MAEEKGKVEKNSIKNFNGYRLINGNPIVSDIKKAPRYLYLAHGKRYRLIKGKYILEN